MCGVEMWRGGVGAAYRLPDVRISRFRLSEKVSRCRPREIARPFGKADKTPHVVQGGLRKPLSPRHDLVRRDGTLALERNAIASDYRRVNQGLHLSGTTLNNLRF
jgi:hypothetical protein